MTERSKQIGKRIKKLRVKGEWNQAQIANLLNISIPAFSKIESGITDVNVSRLYQIAELFEVPVIELLQDYKPDEIVEGLLKELRSEKELSLKMINKASGLQDELINALQTIIELKKGSVVRFTDEG